MSKPEAATDIAIVSACLGALDNFRSHTTLVPRSCGVPWEVVTQSLFFQVSFFGSCRPAAATILSISMIKSFDIVVCYYWRICMLYKCYRKKHCIYLCEFNHYFPIWFIKYTPHTNMYWIAIILYHCNIHTPNMDIACWPRFLLQKRPLWFFQQAMTK